MPNAQLPKYRRPPVSEVVCGIYFQNLVELQVGHVGRLWEGLQNAYPRTDTLRPLPPVLSAGGPSDLMVTVETIQVELDQFPRVWFISEDGASVVQLQRDRLILNWRKQGPDAPYPSYDAIIAELKRLHELLAVFLGREGLGELEVIGLELAYVNTCLYGKELAGPARVGDVIPCLAWPPRGAAESHTLSGLGWNAQLDLPDEEGNLYISVSTTQRRSDGLGALRFDLLARKFSAALETDGLWNWFDTAHVAIVTTFAGITSQDVQVRFWERQS